MWHAHPLCDSRAGRPCHLAKLRHYQADHERSSDDREPSTSFELAYYLSLVCNLIIVSYRGHESERAHDTKHTGHDKWRLGRNLPQQSADCRGRSDRQTAQQVIEANASRAQFRFRKINNHCFARRLTDFPQPADNESDDEANEVARADDSQRIKRERAKSGDDEWPSPYSIRSL